MGAAAWSGQIPPGEGRVTDKHRSDENPVRWPGVPTEPAPADSLPGVVRDVLEDQAAKKNLSAAVKGGIRLRWQHLASVALIIFWVGVGVRYLRVSDGGVLPDGLIGVWRTTAPTHQDRGFRITRETIRLYDGGSNPAPYPIRNVQLEALSGGTLVTIEYEQEGGILSMTVFLDLDGTLRLPNLDDMLWFRTTQAP